MTSQAFQNYTGPIQSTTAFTTCRNSIHYTACRKTGRRKLSQTACSAADLKQVETYIGEKFWKAVPKHEQTWRTSSKIDSPIKIQRLDHSAIEVTDVALSVKFYTEVLGFKQLARPGFPFGGAWLNAGGLTLHLIEKDPSVTKSSVYSEDGSSPPEPWHIRRSEHKAFQVESLDETEATLSKLGVEYHKFVVPGTNAAQIFLFDPDRNGVELGEGYAEIAAHLKDKQP